MITITNKKVAGFKPQWASYRGFSLLFDNPGANVSPMSGPEEANLHTIDCSVGREKDLRLYRGFVKSLTKIGEQLLTNTYLFCPLPSYSYHVTVWDGLNDSRVRNVSAGYRLKLDDFLSNLPGSFLADEEFTRNVWRSPLVTKTDWSIKFKFEKLTKWGNRVLVARLMPADQDSEEKFQRIIEHRTALSTKFEERFGITMQNRFSPHVTLGYFANEQHAELTSPRIDRWNEMIREKVEGQTVTFNSISLYGFTDMVTFFKRVLRD